MTSAPNSSTWTITSARRKCCALIPAGLARLHGALPLGLNENTLTVSLVDPLNLRATEDLRFALGKEIHVVVSPTGQVEELINEHYGSESSSMEDILKQLGEAGELMTLRGDDTSAASSRPRPTARPSSVSSTWCSTRPSRSRASDIHFEPFENEFKIRYRVDGALYEMAPPPVTSRLPVISRVKVMANMNIAERRLPAGRPHHERMIDGRPVDMRVSTLPTQYRRKRRAPRARPLLRQPRPRESGLTPDYIYEYIHETIQQAQRHLHRHRPDRRGQDHHALRRLRKINTIDAKLLTAEDPVEYDIDGIMQVPINEAIGLTFARVLRAFLRQDPDRIMVGEMRDMETAQIAIQASLTGHLVLHHPAHQRRRRAPSPV